MSRLKSSLARSISPSLPTEIVATDPAAAATTAKLTADLTHVVGWALTAVALGCGAFWACIALVVF